MWRVEGDEKYKNHILHVIGWYANNYENFEEHGRQVGSAKVCGHTLAEAIWGINLIEALMIAEIDPTSEQAQIFRRKLFVPLLRLINSQPTHLMNISLWHMAYTMGVGAYYKDSWLMYPYAAYERNGTRLLTDNLTQDGFWLENSITYHFYALSAALYYFMFLQKMEYSNDYIGWQCKDAFTGGGALENMLVKAYVSPLRIIYPNGDFPATNDGWITTLASMKDDYLAVCKLFKGKPEYELLSAAVYAGGEPAKNLTSLLYGFPEKPSCSLFEQETAHLPHNGIAVLRSGKNNVLVKYGNLCGGHSHPDALQICIYPFSMDIGSIAYGVPIHYEYFFVGGSHSTFMVDGRNQRAAVMGTAEVSQDGKSITAKINDAHPNVTAKRSVTITDDAVIDRTEIVCKDRRFIDWVFHGCGEFYTDSEIELADTDLKADLPEESKHIENGYKHFKNVHRRIGAGPFKASWELGGEKLSVVINCSEAVTIYTADTPDNPITQTRKAVVVRAYASELKVNADFNIGR